MRRLFMIGLATMFFSGCIMDVAEPVEQAPPEQQVEAAAFQSDALRESPAYYGDYRPNPTITDDRRLRMVGELMRDSRGEMKMLKGTGEQKRMSIGLAELTIRETKLLQYKPAYNRYPRQPDIEFVKLFVEVRNTGDKPIHFDPLEEIHTDTGERLLWENDIYREGLGGTIDPGEMKAGNIGFIVDDTAVNVLTLRVDGMEVEIRF